MIEMSKKKLFPITYRLLLIAFFAVFVFCLLSFVLPKAMAQLKGEGLTISPPIKELSLKTGESSEQKIRITNPTDKIVEVYPKVMNFKAKGEGGEPDFYESTDETAKFSLAKWISFNQSKLALTPEQVIEFKYTISVPEDAEPGGHYGVVFFATEPPKKEGETSQVALGSMIGSLVLVKVPGQIVEKAFVEEFDTNKNLYLKNNVDIKTRISNLGNVHFKPKGEIKINGWFGSEEKIAFNEQNGNVLPDSTRKFENKWEPKSLKVGRYRADLSLTYGESEKSLTAFVTFWIIPWWVFVILAIVLIVIIVIIIVIIKKRRNKRPPKEKGSTAPQAPPTPPSTPAPPANQPPQSGGTSGQPPIVLR